MHLFNRSNLKNIRKNLRANSTPQEIILWSHLKNSQLGCKFRRQHSIEKYVVDFYCPSKKLVIELDGWQHKHGQQKISDSVRDKFLTGLKIKVLRFWNNEINNNIESVIMEIKRFL